MERQSKKKGARAPARGRQEREVDGVIRPDKPFKKMAGGEYMNWMNEAGGGVI
jgi:hypothetical protein